MTGGVGGDGHPLFLLKNLQIIAIIYLNFLIPVGRYYGSVFDRNPVHRIIRLIS